MANTKKYISLDKLGLYDEKIKDVISNSDAATLKSAKDYADGLAENYDAAGSAATALADAKIYADGKDAAIAEAKKAGTDAAAAAGVADGKAVAAQTAADNAQAAVDALDAYVGDIPEGYTETNVIAYINKKAEETLNSASGGSSESAASVLQALNTYKSENDPKVNKNTEDIAKVQTAVDTEKSRAEGIEAGLRTDVDAIKGDYLKGTDKTELQGNIDTVSGKVTTLIGEDANKSVRTIANEELAKQLIADGAQESLDTLAEIAAWIQSHPDDASAMNKAIDDLEALVGTLPEGVTATTIVGYIQEVVNAEKSRAEGVESGFETRIANVESAVAVDGAIDGRISAAVAAETQRATDVEGGLDTRLQAVEGKLGTGDGSVDSKIATAKQEAIDTAAGDATTKANTAETNAKGYADGLNSVMSDRVDALEAIDHDHSNKDVLDGITAEKVTGWDNASAKVHEHSNLSVLEGITSDKVSAWDKAEGNAKTYADGLNNTMATRVTTLETWHSNFIECSEEEINALFA